MTTKQVAARRKRLDAQLDALKARLAAEIKDVINTSEMTQRDAFELTGEQPSQFSLITTGKLRGFSIERLLRLRALLGGDLTLIINHRADSSAGTIVLLGH